MARHRALTTNVRVGWLVPLLVIVLVGGGTAVAKLSSNRSADPSGGPAACGDALTVVTASSFAPVLSAVAPALADGPGCVQLDVVQADGRVAAGTVAARAADVWIPDDAAWAGTQAVVQLAPAPAAGAGTVLASSPLYLVTDARTAGRVTAAGGGWRGLDGLLTRPAGQPPTGQPPTGPAPRSGRIGRRHAGRRGVRGGGLADRRHGRLGLRAGQGASGDPHGDRRRSGPAGGGG